MLQRVKNGLLREADLNLITAVNICKAAEQIEEDIKKKSLEVDAI